MIPELVKQHTLLPVVTKNALATTTPFSSESVLPDEYDAAFFGDSGLPTLPAGRRVNALMESETNLMGDMHGDFPLLELHDVQDLGSARFDELDADIGSGHPHDDLFSQDLGQDHAVLSAEMPYSPDMFDTHDMLAPQDAVFSEPMDNSIAHMINGAFNGGFQEVDGFDDMFNCFIDTEETTPSGFPSQASSPTLRTSTEDEDDEDDDEDDEDDDEDDDDLGDDESNELGAPARATKRKASKQAAPAKRGKKAGAKARGSRNPNAGATARSGSRSNSSSGVATNEEQKRQVHNVSERNRRNQMKYLYHDLRQCIPELIDNDKPSNRMILSKAVECIHDLQRQDREMEQQLAWLREENRRLTQARAQQSTYSA